MSVALFESVLVKLPRKRREIAVFEKVRQRLVAELRNVAHFNSRAKKIPAKCVHVGARVRHGERRADKGQARVRVIAILIVRCHVWEKVSVV